MEIQPLRRPDFYGEIRGGDGGELNRRIKGYFRSRFLHHLHQLALEEFIRLEKDGRLTKDGLARRLGMSRDDAMNMLGGPVDSDQMSDLFLAMWCEPDFTIKQLLPENQEPAQPAGA